MSSAAQQVLCACISAVMRSPNACYASAYQLVGDELLDISSVYVYERAESFHSKIKLSRAQLHGAEVIILSNKGYFCQYL